MAHARRPGDRHLPRMPHAEPCAGRARGHGVGAGAVTKFVLLTALLLFQPPAPRLTVADCLLRSEHTNTLYSHPHVANLSGENGWDEVGQDAMRVGDVLGTLYIETDGDRRKLHFIAYAGEVYVFVYKHKSDPGAMERMANGVIAWHGACLIRLR